MCIIIQHIAVVSMPICCTIQQRILINVMPDISQACDMEGPVTAITYDCLIIRIFHIAQCSFSTILPQLISHLNALIVEHALS